MDPLETIQKYRFLRDKCDVVLLLSHLGYTTDVEFSAELPWVDIIVGGHSHTQIKGGEIHNGILITQNAKSVPFATHSTLVLQDGKVVEKKAELIAVKGMKGENKTVAELVRPRHLSIVTRNWAVWSVRPISLSPVPTCPIRMPVACVSRTIPLVI